MKSTETWRRVDFEMHWCVTCRAPTQAWTNGDGGPRCFACASHLLTMAMRNRLRENCADGHPECLQDRSEPNPLRSNFAARVKATGRVRR